MKKFIVIIFSSLFMIDFISASSLNLEIDGNSQIDETVVLNVKLTNFNDVDKIYALSYKLSYSDKLKLVNKEIRKDFEIMSSSKDLLYSSTGIGENEVLLTLTFENISLEENEEALIKFTNIESSDSIVDIKMDDVIYSLRCVHPKKEEIPILKAKSEASFTKKDELINNTSEVKEKTNKDLKLTNITLSSGTLKFSEDTLAYNVEVEEDIDEIDVFASAREGLKVEGSGKYSLKEGNNILTIKVSDEDGNTKTYTVNVDKKRSANPIEEIKNETIIEKYKVPIIIVSLIIIFAIIGTIINKKEEKM